MSEKFKVVTDTGGFVHAGPRSPTGKDLGLGEATALANVKELNTKAEALGIKTRYEVVPLS